MTFARFMELALYDPDGGYYRGAESRPGRSGDFLTAPEAHPIFGQAVANQLVEVWERLDRPAPFVVREHGAGTGTLAEAILHRIERARPELLAVLRYVPVEIDAQRIKAFGERLSAAGLADSIKPADDDRPFTGVVLANEVLDALPVHRVGVRAGSLAERFVGVAADGRLVDAWGPPSTPALGERLQADGVRLAEGQSGEVCLALDRWIADAVQSLERGLLLLIDYGALASELYDAVRRPQGTVRAFVRHRISDDLYGHIGRQDLTAHVESDRAGRSSEGRRAGACRRDLAGRVPDRQRRGGTAAGGAGRSGHDPRRLRRAAVSADAPHRSRRHGRVPRDRLRSGLARRSAARRLRLPRTAPLTGRHRNHPDRTTAPALFAEPIRCCDAPLGRCDHGSRSGGRSRHARSTRSAPEPFPTAPDAPQATCPPGFRAPAPASSPTAAHC
jgi:SAM-dependent MidA family methyltransferase